MKRIILAFAILLAGAAWAAAAPWYKWRSADGDHDVCSQFSPGDGWVIIKGPFEDPACRKPGMPH